MPRTATDGQLADVNANATVCQLAHYCIDGSTRQQID